MSYGEYAYGEAAFGEAADDAVLPEPEPEEPVEEPTDAAIDPITSGPWVRRG